MSTLDKWDWLLYGLSVGFVIGYTVAFWVDYLDRKIKDGERKHTGTNK